MFLPRVEQHILFDDGGALRVGELQLLDLLGEQLQHLRDALCVGVERGDHPIPLGLELLGAAAGGLLGNLISKNNSNYTREGYYNNRYYYGGREFRSRRDYNAYREAVRRDMLRDKEARRYQAYNSYRHQHVNARGNSRYGHQQWQNGKGHGRPGKAHGHGHR